MIETMPRGGVCAALTLTHDQRCAGIFRMLGTEDGKLRLVELLEGDWWSSSGKRSESVRQGIVERRQAGKSIRQIEKEVGCHYRMVKRVLDAAGVE